MIKIVIICGPTAVGKSEAGIELATRVGGEIISADSQQVWRGFDVGTAKANLTEHSSVPHHLIDVADPREHFDAARFVALADLAIDDIVRRGRRPFVVGGTGMFLRMLVHGMCDAPPKDPDLRAQMEREIARKGAGALHERLGEVDPEAASKIHPNDTTRIVRALEIHSLTGMPASRIRAKHRFGERRYDALKIGLDIDRAVLYERIDRRVDRMVENGLVDEVRSLLERYDERVQPFAAVGYREIVDHIKGRIDLDEAIRLTKRNSRRFAKRQLTWFRADPEIRWFAPDKLEAMAVLVDTEVRWV